MRLTRPIEVAPTRGLAWRTARCAAIGVLTLAAALLVFAVVVVASSS